MRYSNDKGLISNSLTTYEHVSRRVLKNIVFCFLSATILIFIVSCSSRRSKSEEDKTSSGTVTSIDAIDFKPTINIYVENSGSMDGYVKGQTEFENIVYNYLVDLNLAKIPSKMNFFYINSRILSQENDVKTFIEDLDPSTFRARGGNRGRSDISQMLSMIMNDMNDSTVSMFISDCIFSPGRGEDATEYLTKQQTGIKDVIGQYFNEHPKFAVLGYRCMSTFNGYCYDRNDTGRLFNGRRPFYIWMFGTQSTLKCIQHEMQKKNFHKNDVKDELMFFATGITMPDSCYAVKRGSGNFDLKKSDPKRSIEHLRSDKNGKVRFAVEINYANFILSDEYLRDTSMYTLSDNRYKIVSVDSVKGGSKYTHIIRIEADRVYPSNLVIQLNANVPTWLDHHNDEAGDAISESNADKTFGIKYMTNGIAEAILRQSYYTRFTININK